ncbi:hypothetical protein CH300_06730 [Rhodococcus sp. 15-1154-1]|nr:FGGY-family carbohydrate kinase [Rhodococcus sp. 15-1154-1]OZF07634.1 hypothetical protein CH300_06730 [Rhodococcus sp. 15-1154-1]
MTAVLGASLGVSGIRAACSDVRADPQLSTETVIAVPEGSQDPWGSVTWAVHKFARENGATGTVPVLALRDKNPSEVYGVEHADGLALVSDIGAQIGALQESGDLTPDQTVALFDVGAGGVTVSIVECDSGHVLGSRRSTVLSGDGCDARLSQHLLGSQVLDPESRDLFVETGCEAKERLSSVTAVEVVSPAGVATLHRSVMEDLVRDSVYDAVALASSMITDAPHVDALFAVGGGANMQIVRQSLIDGLSVPVFVPREPEALAARGAMGMARRLVVAQHATDDAGGTAGGDGPASVVTGSRARPRHSDTSSRRLTRLRASRYLGGGAVALIAGGVVVSIAAASSDRGVEPPALDYTPVITSSSSVATTVAPSLPPGPPDASVVPDTTSAAVTTTPEASTGDADTTDEVESTDDEKVTTTRRRETTTSSAPTPTPTATTRQRDDQPRNDPPQTTRPTATTRPPTQSPVRSSAPPRTSSRR